MRKPQPLPGKDRTYKLALSLARRLTTEAPNLLPALVPILDSLRPCHAGLGFACVRWHGATYTFTPTQARVVSALWKASENGVPDCRQEQLLVEAESESGRLIDVFGKDHPALNALIVPGALRGTWRLAPGP